MADVLEAVVTASDDDEMDAHAGDAESAENQGFSGSGDRELDKTELDESVQAFENAEETSINAADSISDAGSGYLAPGAAGEGR